MVTIYCRTTEGLERCVAGKGQLPSCNSLRILMQNETDTKHPAHTAHGVQDFQKCRVPEENAWSLEAGAEAKTAGLLPLACSDPPA